MPTGRVLSPRFTDTTRGSTSSKQLFPKALRRRGCFSNRYSSWTRTGRWSAIERITQQDIQTSGNFRLRHRRTRRDKENEYADEIFKAWASFPVFACAVRTGAPFSRQL